ncbi:hypothetical protein V495_01849 [Pseudogymnoascus sp. VKM F-4514 (FW-929)]|nr:hypothetical protein V495_01849 [Pseudogymnoascus sp. VKM F-4514 (FW-929)]
MLIPSCRAASRVLEKSVKNWRLESWAMSYGAVGGCQPREGPPMWSILDILCNAITASPLILLQLPPIVVKHCQHHPILAPPRSFPCIVTHSGALTFIPKCCRRAEMALNAVGNAADPLGGTAWLYRFLAFSSDGHSPYCDYGGESGGYTGDSWRYTGVLHNWYYVTCHRTAGFDSNAHLPTSINHQTTNTHHQQPLGYRASPGPSVAMR